MIFNATIKILLIVLALGFLGVHANNISPHEFTALFKKNLEKSFKGREFKLCGKLCIKTKNNTIYLDNAYREYSTNKESFKSLFHRHTGILRNEQEVLKSGKKYEILPVIKSKDYIDELEATFKKLNKKPNIYYQKIANDLYLLYVFDTPNSMKFVTNSDLKELNIQNTIRDIAVKNLTNYYNKVGAKLVHKDIPNSKGIYIVSAKHNYEASIIINKEFLKNNKLDIDGDIVIFIPARDTVMITGSRDKKGIYFASEIAQKAYSELPYTISPYGYMIKENKISRLKVK